MFTWHRTASMAPGKGAQVMKFAHESAAFVKKKTGVELTIGMPISGNPNRVRWSARYETLAAFEAASAKLMSDPKWLEMVAKAADNFIAGSAHDEIWRDS